MKFITLILAFFLCCLLSQGQTITQSPDSLLRKIIQKNIVYPYFQGYDSSGVALIKIFKNKDSLTLTVLYASGIQFDIEEDENIILRINKSKDWFPNGYSALIPVYFYYHKEGYDIPVSNIAEAALQNHVKKLGKKVHLLSPIPIDGFETVR